jgi:hypothetical protein
MNTVVAASKVAKIPSDRGRVAVSVLLIDNALPSMVDPMLSSLALRLQGQQVLTGEVVRSAIERLIFGSSRNVVELMISAVSTVVVKLDSGPIRTATPTN